MTTTTPTTNPPTNPPAGPVRPGSPWQDPPQVPPHGPRYIPTQRTADTWPAGADTSDLITVQLSTCCGALPGDVCYCRKFTAPLRRRSRPSTRKRIRRSWAAASYAEFDAPITLPHVGGLVPLTDPALVDRGFDWAKRRAEVTR